MGLTTEPNPGEPDYCETCGGACVASCKRDNKDPRIITDIVTVSLDEVIHSATQRSTGGIEGFLDLLDELVFAGQEPEDGYVKRLMDQEYKIVGVTPDGDLLVWVTGEQVEGCCWDD